MKLIALVLVAACSSSAPRPATVAPVTTTATTASRPFAVTVTGHGPPVILIPGLASSGDVWKSTVAHLANSYTCHVLTLAGFAGQPRVPAPMLATIRDGIAAYIADEHLDHPVIVGHSLGGFLALDLAVHAPADVGRLVIVDSLPFLAAAFVPDATEASAKQFATAMRAQMALAKPDVYRQRLRDSLATMITAPANQQLALGWGLASDPTAVGDAMAELMEHDLRDAIGAVRVPALVIETWQGRPGADRAQVEGVYRAQYAKLAGVELAMAETARHFVMLDDPAFLFARMDAFLQRTEK